MELVAIIRCDFNFLFKKLLPFERHLALDNMSNWEKRIAIFADKILFYLWVLQISIFSIISEFKIMVFLEVFAWGYRLYIEIKVGLAFILLYINFIKTVCCKNEIVRLLISCPPRYLKIYLSKTYFHDFSVPYIIFVRQLCFFQDLLKFCLSA